MKSLLRVLLSLDVFYWEWLLILSLAGILEHNFFLDKYPGLIPTCCIPSVARRRDGLGRSMLCSLEACCGNLRTPLPRERKPTLCYVTSRRALRARVCAFSSRSGFREDTTDPTPRTAGTIRKAEQPESTGFRS